MSLTSRDGLTSVKLIWLVSFRLIWSCKHRIDTTFFDSENVPNWFDLVLAALDFLLNKSDGNRAPGKLYESISSKIFFQKISAN